MGRAFSVGTSSRNSAEVLWDDNGTQAQWELDAFGGTFNSGLGTPTTEFVADPLGVITSQPVLKQTISGNAGCRQFRWRDAAGRALPSVCWFSSWIYFTDINPVGSTFWNVWQTKTKADVDSDPKVIIDGPGGFNVFICTTRPGCDTGVASADFTMPVGRWVSIEMRVIASTDITGRATLYLDGALVADVNAETQYPCTLGDSCRQWSLNNYSDAATGSVHHALARISATRSLRALV